MICMRCGAAASVIKAHALTWFPKWTFWLILVHPFLFALVAWIMSKRVPLQAPFCEDCKNHWTTRRLLLWLSLIGLVILVPGLVVLIELVPAGVRDDFAPFVYFGVMLAIASWLALITIIKTGAIRAADVSKNQVLLANIAEEFEQAVEELEIERRVRLRQWDDEAAQPTAPRDFRSEGIQAQLPPPVVPPDAIES
jgi:hypothetical protein